MYSIIQYLYTMYSDQCVVLTCKKSLTWGGGPLWKDTVRYHCGGWPEEVNTCFLNSYMVYL
jgi:hypothetical protein